MSLEEANKIVNISLRYSYGGWSWDIFTFRPYGDIIGYNVYPTSEEALEELKVFLRYFTPNVLKDGDSIRKYVEKHRPTKDEHY